MGRFCVPFDESQSTNQNRRDSISGIESIEFLGLDELEFIEINWTLDPRG